jgi:ribosomal 30S subunit maturation factor RimM
VKFKTLTLSAATAALLATGAYAQDTTKTQTDTTTPPAATMPDKPVAQKPTTSETTAATTTTKTTTESLKFTSSAGPDQLMASELIGTKVRNSANENLGDINDVMVNNEGSPSVAIIGVGGFLGIGEKNVGVPFDSLKFTMNDQKRVAQLDVTKQALESAPTFVYPEKTASKTN